MTSKRDARPSGFRTPDPALEGATGAVPGYAPLAKREAPPSLGTIAANYAKRWLLQVGGTLLLVWAAGWGVINTVVPGRAQARWTLMTPSGTAAGRVASEATRAFALPRDGTMAPDEAGATIAELSHANRWQTYGFQSRPSLRLPPAPWNSVDKEDLNFRSGVSKFYRGPDVNTILEAAARGLPSDEVGFLRRHYGTAALWTAFDAAARAPQVDLLAGRFVLPPKPDATVAFLGTMPIGEVKNLAYGGVARAAWYLAEGRRSEAETAIRSVISFGFQVMDFGTSMQDEVAGQSVITIGRNALEHLFIATGDPRLADVRKAAAAFESGRVSAAVNAQRLGGTAEDAEAFVIAQATAPGATFAERINVLRKVPQLVCGTAEGIRNGPSPAVQAAFAAVRRDYARLPGEKALLDLVEGQADGSSAISIYPSTLAEASAALLSQVYFNPRAGSCTVFATASVRFNP
jgi:hypothetical protein